MPQVLIIRKERCLILHNYRLFTQKNTAIPESAPKALYDFLRGTKKKIVINSHILE